MGHHNQFIHIIRYKYRLIILICIWLLGLILGFYISSASFEISTSLMRTAVTRSVSIVNLLAVRIFPLVVSAVLVHYTGSVCIFPIAFLKAIFLGYCMYCIALTFGSSGWLVQWLLLFSESGVVVISLLFWIRSILRINRSFIRDVSILIIFSIIIVLIDLFAVSPFLKILFDN